MVETIEMQMSYTGTEILGKRYDLIHIDFDAEHPSPDLIKMVQKRPEELIARTDLEAAAFVADYLNSHLEVCDNGCSKLPVARVSEQVKGY